MFEKSTVTKRAKPIHFLYAVGALLLGITGQLLLGNNQPVPAALFYLLAVVLIVIAFRQQPGPNAVIPPFQSAQTGKWRQWGYVTGGLSVVSALFAFFLFTTSTPAVIPWLLHLASLALLVVSIIWIDGTKQSGDRRSQTWTKVEIGIFLAIFAIAAFMRLYRFDQVPFGLWYDEADNGLEALKILNQSGYLPVFVQPTALPAHFIYLIALSFQLLGVSALSIRAVSVFLGLATVAAAYLAGREFFDQRRMGLVLAFLLAVSRWDINWSRIGMHGVTVPFFELLTLGLLLRALRRQRLIDYTLAGLSLGMSLGFYAPLRLFPAVIGLFLLAIWWRHHDFVRSAWRGLLLFGLGVIIASVPVSRFAIFQPEVFFDRMRVTSIFEGKTTEAGWTAVAQTAREHLLMFNYQGDRNGRHNLPGEPMLDPITGTLLVLGVALRLWRIRQPGSWLLLAWLILMLAPGVFSLDFESPQSLRAIGSLPAAYMLAAVPINAIWQEWEKLAGKLRPIYFLIPLVLVLGGVGVVNYHIYFDRQAESFDSWIAFSTPDTIIANLMKKLGNQVNYYVSVFYYNTPTIRFLAPEVPAYQKLQTNEGLPLRLDGSQSSVFILDSDRKQAYQQAQRDYPHGDFEEIKAPNGQTVLYEIYLKPEDITAVQGLTASYYRNTNWSGEPFLVRQEASLNFNWRDGDPATFPFSVEWQGILYAHTYGAYRLSVQSPAATELYIDEVRLALADDGAQTAEVTLAKGAHNIRIRTQGKAGHFELAWQPPSGAETPIPTSSLLLPPITNNGLLGRYYPDGDWQGPFAFSQIDPEIHFYYQEIPLPRPYTVEWVGSIDIPSAGRYLFGLESIDESALWIDDTQVLDDRPSGQYQEAGIDLAAGRHSIRIRFADRTGYTHINLYWTPPGSSREIIPQQALFPPQGGLNLLQPPTAP